MQITKGCACCKPYLVATAAEGHRMAKPIPVKNHNQPADLFQIPGSPCCFKTWIFWKAKVRKRGIRQRARQALNAKKTGATNAERKNRLTRNPPKTDRRLAQNLKAKRRK